MTYVWGFCKLVCKNVQNVHTIEDILVEMCKCIMSLTWLIYIYIYIYIYIFECNEIEMFIYVLDQVFDVYVMVEIAWWSVGNSVFPLLFCMEEVILMEEVWMKLF